MPRVLFLFSLVNLVIGSGAFVVSGILGAVAADLGVGVPAAGQAMTAYAISTALLAPALLLATGRWERQRVLFLGLALFMTGNVVSALAPSLPVLLVGRVVMGTGAVFTPVAAGMAVALVAPNRRGQALAITFLGFSLSYVVGVPVGAWLGAAYGWRVPVWAAAAASGLALLAVMRWAPRDPVTGVSAAGPVSPFSGAGALLQRPEVLLVLALTLSYFVAIFTVFSYIGPVLQRLVPMSDGRLSLTLMLFGLAGVAGTLLGGAANDRFGPLPTLAVQLGLLIAMMIALPLTAGAWPLMVAVLLPWGMAGFGMMAPQQSRLAALAPQQAPLLLSLNASMVYLGTAAGAAVGGAATPLLGLARLSWAGAAFAGVGLLLLARTAASGRRG